MFQVAGFCKHYKLIESLNSSTLKTELAMMSHIWDREDEEDLPKTLMEFLK